jgi:hypothetical protein
MESMVASLLDKGAGSLQLMIGGTLFSVMGMAISPKPSFSFNEQPEPSKTEVVALPSAAIPCCSRHGCCPRAAVVDSGADLHVLNNRGETYFVQLLVTENRNEAYLRMKMEEDRVQAGLGEGPQDG